MSILVTTREAMLARLAYHTQEQERRMAEQLDHGDGVLAMYGGNAVIYGLHVGLEALDLGEENGYNGPACHMTILVDADGYAIPAKVIESKNGPCWILRDDAEAYYGTRFLSLCKETWCTQRRIYVPVIPQRMSKLGISERTLVVPANQRLVASVEGASVVYKAVPLEPLKYFYTKIRTVKP